MMSTQNFTDDPFEASIGSVQSNIPDRTEQRDRYLGENLERAVGELSDFATFRDWFAKFDVEVWDREFEADVTGGKLGALADKAIQDLKEGRCTEL